MRHYEEDLVQSLYNLYFIYQEYMLNHNNIKLDVLIQNKMINFKLYDDIELIDEFGLSFKEKEYDIYSYVCLRIMIMLFSEKRIYNGHNIIYNRIDNPDIKLEINDDVILRMILGVIISYSGNIEVHIDSILNLITFLSATHLLHYYH